MSILYIFELYQNGNKKKKVEFFDIDLDSKYRIHPSEVSPRESFRHQYILHICYDILKDNQMTGAAKAFWDGYKEHLVPCFCLTDMTHPFVTSERPAFMSVLNTGEKEQFFISTLTPNEVDVYNHRIAENNKLIISNTNKLDVDKI